MLGWTLYERVNGFEVGGYCGDREGERYSCWEILAS